ncbi:MAG: VIT1/CCC1 transporter family protein [Puia sp.]|nr:VIT1/CCC1 transporter family protein [Puia sp.]
MKRPDKSDLIKDIIIGMSDGLTVPFALTAGLSGVLSTNHLIVVSGLSEIAAGCISMGLGGYLAGESELDHYNTALQNEYHEIDRTPDSELKEVQDILLDLGIEENLSRAAALQISKDRDRWADFMMKLELKLEQPSRHRAAKSAGTIALSYLTGGFIPLFPYILFHDSRTGFYASCGVTILALVLFGYFRSTMTGQPVAKGTFKMTVTGIVAAASAYLLAKAVS